MGIMMNKKLYEVFQTYTNNEQEKAASLLKKYISEAVHKKVYEIEDPYVAEVTDIGYDVSTSPIDNGVHYKVRNPHTGDEVDIVKYHDKDEFEIVDKNMNPQSEHGSLFTAVKSVI